MSNKQSEIPQVNLLSILSGLFALLSIFLPWWGITGSGLGLPGSTSWSLWSLPVQGNSNSQVSQLSMIMNWASISMLASALVTTTLVIIGSFARHNRILIAGFSTGIGMLFAYTAIIAYAISTTCQNCIPGPFGSQTSGNNTVSWGFQPGFYTFLISGFLALGALVLHPVFLNQATEQRQDIRQEVVDAISTKSCNSCGRTLRDNAKFCSNCGVPTSKPQPLLQPTRIPDADTKSPVSLGSSQ